MPHLPTRFNEAFNEEEDRYNGYAGMQYPRNTRSENYYCPLCNRELKERTSRRNQKFLGCDYPRCLFSCDVLAANGRALTKPEHDVVALGGVNPSIQNKRTIAVRVAEAKANRRVDIVTIPPPPGTYFTNPAPNLQELRSENFALRTRVELLETQVKELNEFVKSYQERQKKIGFEVE